MKKILSTTLLLSSLFLCSMGFSSIEGARCLQSEEAVKNAAYGHINAKGLKSLIDAKTPFVLLDGRGSNWHDGNVIPGARLAWYESSAEEFAAVIPSRETLIVVYCYSFTCPLGPRLAQKLIDLGYLNVIEYPAGLQEWRDTANYPVDDI